MFKKWLYNLQEITLCLVQKWWRPVGSFTIIGTIITNCIVIPLKRGEGVDLMGLTAVITAYAPLVAIRAWEKVKAVPKDPPSSEA